jgi:hypothetical protein
MRSCLRLFFWLMSACFLSFVSAPSSQAQCGVNTIGFGDVGLVPGNPFHAEIVSTSSRPSPLQSALAQRGPELVARDGEGRARTERVTGPFKRDTGPEAGNQVQQHIIMICDTSAQTLTQIDTLNATAKIIHSVPSAPISPAFPGRSFCSTRLPSNRVAHQPVEDLGDQVIEGVQAHGVRMRLRGPGTAADGELSVGESVRDVWCSDELSAIVLVVTENTKTGVKSSTAMRNIERTEPDPALFQIPADYAVSESVAEPHERHNPHVAPSEQP